MQRVGWNKASNGLISWPHAELADQMVELIWRAACFRDDRMPKFWWILKGGGGKFSQIWASNRPLHVTPIVWVLRPSLGVEFSGKQCHMQNVTSFFEYFNYFGFHQKLLSFITWNNFITFIFFIFTQKLTMLTTNFHTTTTCFKFWIRNFDFNLFNCDNWRHQALVPYQVCGHLGTAASAEEFRDQRAGP